MSGKPGVSNLPPRKEDKWRQLTQLVVKELPAVYLQVKHTMPSRQRFLEYWESLGLAEQLGSLGHPPGCKKDELLLYRDR